MNEDNILIDSENLENIVKMLNVYLNEEKKIIDDCNKYNNLINDNYKTKNSYYIEQLQNDNYNSLKTILKNHELNIFLINKRIENVKNKINRLRTIENSSRIDRIV